MAQSTKNINKKRTHIAKEKHNHVFLFIFLTLIVAAGVVYGVLIFKPRESKSSEENSTDTSKTEDNKSDDTSKKKDEKTEEEKKSDEATRESEKNNPQYEGKDPNSYDDLTGIINASIIDGNVDIRVAVDQSVSGTCNFTITTPSGKTIAGSGALEIGPSSSFCSFATPSTESGVWKISVVATSSGKRGVITSEANI